MVDRRPVHAGAPGLLFVSKASRFTLLVSKQSRFAFSVNEPSSIWLFQYKRQCGTLGLLRYATASPRLAASIVGQLGRDVGLAESGLPRVKRDALLTLRANAGCCICGKVGPHDYCERSDNSRSSSAGWSDLRPHLAQSVISGIFEQKSPATGPWSAPQERKRANTRAQNIGTFHNRSVR